MLRKNNSRALDYLVENDNSAISKSIGKSRFETENVLSPSDAVDRLKDVYLCGFVADKFYIK